MAEHFLKEHVAGMLRAEASPHPWYNPDGDCIIYQVKDEAMVADRIDESLTIYRSHETGRAIGYQIKGVLALIKRFGLDGIEVEWSETNQELLDVSVCSLLLAAYEIGQKTINRRRGYATAMDSAANQRMQLDNLRELGLK